MVDLATEVKDVVARLRERAVLHSKWDRWELGDGPAPAALKEGVTAAMLFEAATEIEATESRATAAEGRVALLEEERDEMTVAANDYAHQAAKAMLRERELSETLAAFVQRFEIYAGPSDMHAGKHNLELLTLGRARLAKGGQ